MLGQHLNGPQWRWIGNMDYAHCQMTVMGPLVEKFVEDNKGEGADELLTFSELLSMPDGEDDPDEWRRENWGTTDEPSEVEQALIPGGVVYDFLTDNTAPLEWLHEASQAYPFLTFTLEVVRTTDLGPGWGKYTWRYGQLLHEETHVPVFEEYLEEQRSQPEAATTV